MITNIVATLKGTPARIDARTYIVSGHYDSMCTSPTDAVCDAPGANDDASGTAAVSGNGARDGEYKFDATIIFMAVAGEEQGLLGSTYAAEQTKTKAMDVEAMFTNDIIGQLRVGMAFATHGQCASFQRECPQMKNLKRLQFGAGSAARMILLLGNWPAS